MTQSFDLPVPQVVVEALGVVNAILQERILEHIVAWFAGSFSEHQQRKAQKMLTSLISLNL